MNEPSAAFRAIEPCRIVVADDHAIIRDGLTAILVDAGGFDVVGTACDGKAAIEAVGRLKPNLLVIDLTMPHTDGAEAIKVIKRRYPDVRFDEEIHRETRGLLFAIDWAELRELPPPPPRRRHLPRAPGVDPVNR